MRQSRRRSWPIRVALLISLLIHISIGLLFLITIRREPVPELLPPPSAVTMLFESGRKNGPTLPNPELQATPATPPAPASPPAPVLPQAETPLPAPSPKAPAVVQPPEPLHPPEIPLAETPPSPVPEQQASPEPFAPPPSPLVPPQTPPVETPPPPITEPAPIPPPPPPPRRTSRPAPTSNAPQSPRQPQKQAAPSKPSGFPAPMNFSFGGSRLTSPALVRPQPSSHIPGTIDMSLGPAAKGAADTTPFSDRDEEAEGADWRNALSRWVSEHAYYPDQARREAEEGDAKVHVVAAPNGRVKMVELIGKSGSMWLDLALLALFRDQQIPPLPYRTNEDIDFAFTMHYVLIRSR